MAVADLGDAHAHGADADARQQGELRGPSAQPAASLTRETSTTATIASAIPTRTSGGGTPSRTMPAATGIDGRQDAGHRRDDPHPADGQPAVERA